MPRRSIRSSVGACSRRSPLPGGGCFSFGRNPDFIRQELRAEMGGKYQHRHEWHRARCYCVQRPTSGDSLVVPGGATDLTTFRWIGGVGRRHGSRPYAGYPPTRPIRRGLLGESSVRRRSCFAIAKISDSARALDQDYIAAGDPLRVPPGSETLLTVGDLARIRQGWTLLLNIRYIMPPGGGYIFEAGQPRLSKNALVLAVRSIMKFQQRLFC